MSARPTAARPLKPVARYRRGKAPPGVTPAQLSDESSDEGGDGAVEAKEEDEDVKLVDGMVIRNEGPKAAKVTVAKLNTTLNRVKKESSPGEHPSSSLSVSFSASRRVEFISSLPEEVSEEEEKPKPRFRLPPAKPAAPAAAVKSEVRWNLSLSRHYDRPSFHLQSSEYETESEEEESDESEEEPAPLVKPVFVPKYVFSVFLPTIETSLLTVLPV
jgi:microfibrillar-associated protein 1